MAIVVEQEVNNKQGYGGVIMGVLGIAALAIVAYYVFMRRPDLVEVAIPTNFENTVQIAKIDLSPEDVINNVNFRNLQAHVPPMNPSTGGRSNPFFASF